jgi:hypothetical protein
MANDTLAYDDARRRITPASRVLITALAIAVGMAVVTLARAHSPVDPATVSEGHPTGHTQDHAGMAWPPQPRGLENVVFRGDSTAETLAVKARERLQAALERVALRRADVKQALGNRFTRLPLVEQEDKDGTPRNPVLTWFSHATNSTVEVEMESQRVRTVRTIPAAEYQPEITDEEVADAEGIARNHFAGLGEERVAQLEAFGILAYQPTGKGFFDTRVIYISFHPDNDSYPEYAAWVDLTGRRVLRILKEKQ